MADLKRSAKEVMRDAKRISAVLKAIEEAWRADPDLRLGQIVVTATNLCGRKTISPEVFSLGRVFKNDGTEQCPI